MAQSERSAQDVFPDGTAHSCDPRPALGLARARDGNVGKIAPICLVPDRRRPICEVSLAKSLVTIIRRQWQRDKCAPASRLREHVYGSIRKPVANALPQNVFAALEPHLNTVNVKFGEVVAETDQPITRVYFPHHCVISVVVEMEVGDLIETAMVGRDGVANATSALDGKI